MFIFQKEKTWYAPLVESRSRIKYSVAPGSVGALSRQWNGWRGMQNRFRRQSERFQRQPERERFLARQQLGEVYEQVESRQSFCFLPSKVFSFPHCSTVRFFFSKFSNLFFQPQSIRPTSANFSAISSNCLLERSLASHATEIINLSVSKRRIQSEIFSILLSCLEK